MPRIENYITHRPITRTTTPKLGAQSGPTLTLRDVRMPRKGNLDDVRASEPTVLDAFQRAELKAIRDRQKLDKFAKSLPPVSLRPRLIRPVVAPIASISDVGEAIKAIEPPRAVRVPSIYDRHGLTSRGVKLSASTGERLRAELAADVAPNPLIRRYPPLR